MEKRGRRIAGLAFEINVNLVWSSGATPMIGNAILLETGGGTRRLHSDEARLSNVSFHAGWSSCIGATRLSLVKSS